MSYGQQSRTTESWNNDPNNFSNPSGPEAGFRSERGNWNDNSQSQYGSQRPTHDPTDTSTWNSSSGIGSGAGAGGRRGDHPVGEGLSQWSAGPGENYSNTGTAGNTTDFNTHGTGGDFGSTARSAGGGTLGGRDDWQSRDSRDNYSSSNWQSRGDNYDDDVNPGAGKASVGERLKGNAEKLAGRVTGNPSLVERGQVRKSGNPDDTNWNSNDY
ncbi:hypothetical protein BD413DRAFT_89460 [Trametes elegans]|nr:hypothetical protein BD413DRAFT_89460 [Trametes elegans]